MKFIGKLKIDKHFHANRVLEINQATYVKSLQIAAVHFEGLHYPDMFNVLFVIFKVCLNPKKIKDFHIRCMKNGKHINKYNNYSVCAI